MIEGQQAETNRRRQKIGEGEFGEVYMAEQRHKTKT
jgi:hypothetical protein